MISFLVDYEFFEVGVYFLLITCSWGIVLRLIRGFGDRRDRGGRVDGREEMEKFWIAVF